MSFAVLPNYTLRICQTGGMFAKDFCHAVGMSPDPQAFASRVLEAFEAAGNHTDAEVLAAGGPSDSTMTHIRAVSEGRATWSEPREPTWTKIDNAAGWQRGSARAVWKGGEPTPRPRIEGEVNTDPEFIEYVKRAPMKESLRRELLAAIERQQAKDGRDSSAPDSLSDLP